MPIPQVEGEKSYLVERWSLNGLQIATLAATPLYALSALRRGQFSIRQLVRYNWVVPILGGAAGGAGAFAVSSQESGAATASRTMEMRMDKKTVRRDDLQLVGSVIGALLVPALFLRRAGLINGLLGGAGLGGAGGIITHYAQNGGSLDELKKKGQEALKEGKGLTSQARQIGNEVGSEAREKGRELTAEAQQKAQLLSAEAREKGDKLAERVK